MQPFFWRRLLYNVQIQDLIDQGFLSPLEYENASFLRQEDLRLNKAQTDFELDDFVERINQKERDVIDRILKAERERNSVLVFCSSVKQAEKFARIVPNAECVSAKTPPVERDYIIRGFKAGRIKTVFNMGVLTTGFDHPALDTIVLIRPTRSVALYYQMVGRGIRPCAGKTSCLVIDYSNNVAALGRLHTIRLIKRDKWELESETGSWHNCALYSYIIKLKRKQGLPERQPEISHDFSLLNEPREETPTLFADDWPPM
jgi:DNA repair protein RadD